MCGIFGFVGNSNIVYIKDDLIKSGYKLKDRGPDNTTIIDSSNFFLMFHRLAIMNQDHFFDQPFIYNELDDETYYVMCNGEIYNYKEIIDEHGITFNTKFNDTCIIYPLFKYYNYNFTQLNRKLNGEYSLVILKLKNGNLDTLYMSTDTSSVRPLFYCIDPQSNIVCFSSLLKGLTNIDQPILNRKLIRRMDGGDIVIIKFKNDVIDSEFQTTYKFDYNLSGLMKPLAESKELYKEIYETLTRCVVKRLESSRPICCLLSGGLDSSLVAAIAAKELKKFGKKLKTFSIGMIGGTDLEYARKVSEHIGSEHTEVIFKEEEGLSVIEDVIKTCESYDITTIRASIPQYLLARYISKNTDIKVVLNGDGSDECWCGYLYNYNAPSLIEMHRDNMKLIDNIHYFDGLRVDRNISRWGLEARVPFLDWEIVKLSKMVAPSVKKPTVERMEKYILRKSVEEMDVNLLPKEVLWRRKEAFSDGVSKKEKSWYQIIQEYIENKSCEYLTEDVEYEFNKPISKESEYYRRVFSKEFTREVERVIPYYWMPNWNNEVKDPSARKLNVYK